MVKIFVGRIPSGLGKDKLQELFGKYGTVGECEIIKDYGFVHLDSDKAADEAIAALNNFEISGGRLTVEKSHGKPAKRRDDYRDRRGGQVPVRRDTDRRDSDFNRRNVRDRSPMDNRRGDDYYRSDRASDDDRSGSNGRSAGRFNSGSSGYGQRYPSGDPGSVYGVRGDRGYARRGPPPPPSVVPYHDNGGQSYNNDPYSQPVYSSAPRLPEYNSSVSGGYDSYNRYSGGNQTLQNDSRYSYSVRSAAPAAGVTRRY